MGDDMTESEMQQKIDDERKRGEKEKQRAVSRTILSIIGVVGGICILFRNPDAETAEQWGSIICVAAMIAALVWLHNKIVGD